MTMLLRDALAQVEPDVRADLVKICESTVEYAMIYDNYGHKACPFRDCNAQGRDGYLLNHKPECPVTIALEGGE